MSVAATDDPATSIRPLSRAEYDRMIEAGFFEGERIELLEGVLVRMPPMKDRHARAIKVLNRRFVRELPDRFEVGPQTPIAVSDWSEPEPDISITEPMARDAGHPTSAHLVVEVTLTTHRTDLVIKPRIYAQAGVPEYWVIDLKADRAVVHTDPTDDGYATVSVVDADGALSFAGVDVPVRDLL